MTDRRHRPRGSTGPAVTRPGARSPIDDWQRLSALYEEADGLDAAALEARLASWRAEGCPLLPQLEQMLAARDRVQRSDFLGSPPALPETGSSSSRSDAGAAAGGWTAGSRIGAYRLLSHVGSGGMAEVWRAERADGAFNREVAVKLLFQHADSTQRAGFTQRFARERDILASLHHPHIAALHDAGVTPDGQPWLALEYVEGEPLTTWCDRERLDIAARVQLFRQVLLAVQHAHANLVIHRDIKPANILVTRAGDVKLLDFGIAKLQEADRRALDETELTRHAGRPLTVQYASPEQLRGLPLTTACDVYALGVVLYELLCGERPYELKMATAAQLEQAIVEIEPRAMSRRGADAEAAGLRATTPKALRHALAPELDAVVLKMLAKRPADRYGSIESVLADIDRWRRGEPVLARAPTTLYRLRKFAMRHPWGVGLSAFAGVALVTVAVLAAVLGLQARQEAATSAAATQFLFDMFLTTDPDNSQGIGPAASLLLDKGREKVLQTMGKQPGLQADLLTKIAELQRARGDYRRADQTLAEVVRLDASLGRRQDEARALASRAWVAYYLGDSGRAEATVADALRRHPDPDHDPAFAAESLRVNALLRRNAGDLPAAIEALQGALTKATEAFGSDESRTLSILNDLASVQAQAGAYDAALTSVGRAIAVLQNRTDASPTDRVIARSFQASIEQQAGHYAKAMAHLTSLASDCERWLEPGSSYCGQVRQREAVVLMSLGRARDAALLLPNLEVLARSDASPVHQAEALMTTCRVVVLSGQGTSAADSCAKMRRLGSASADGASSGAIKFAASLVWAEVLIHDGMNVDALATLTESEGRFAGQGSVPLRFVARLHLLRGLALQSSGQPTEGVALLRRASGEFDRSLGAEHVVSLLAGAHLAMALAQAGQRDEAAALLDRALPRVGEELGSGSPVFAKLARWRELVKSSQGSQPIGLTDLLV